MEGEERRGGRGGGRGRGKGKMTLPFVVVSEVLRRSILTWVLPVFFWFACGPAAKSLLYDSFFFSYRGGQGGTGVEVVRTVWGFCVRACLRGI